MSDQSNQTVVGTGSAPLYPNRNDLMCVPVDVKSRFPCTTILIHGVNDLGTDFGHVEKGFCQGLNDRLGRSDFVAAEYSHGRMANEKRQVASQDLMKDLDNNMYRRQATDATYSPLIPFYWGFKANKDDLSTDPKDQKRNGQFIDKYGNRLDSNLCKNGGMFANATTNLPDMFNTNFKGGFKTWALNKLQGDPTHPLYACPNRHYMILAAKRLAALVRQIRVVDENETVNIIAHSQGTMISLLAQAFLAEGLMGSKSAADRPVDNLILIDSPYSLREELMDRLTQTGETQQTTYARAKTLGNIVGLIHAAKHSSPALSELEWTPGQDNFGITGPVWKADKAVRLTGPHEVTGTDSEKMDHPFTERDNRSSCFVYWCPQDSTVGLTGVAGMGTLGLPESQEATPANGAKESIKLISDKFFQRVFTRRKRDGKSEMVGTAPHHYVVRESGESSTMTSMYDETLKRASVKVGTTRNINAPELANSFAPALEDNTISGTGGKKLWGYSASDVSANTQSTDELEASIAVAASDLETLPAETLAWPSYVPNVTGLPSESEVQASVNDGKDGLDQTQILKVFSTKPPTPGQVMVIRKETPNEGKLRFMNTKFDPSSYHSGVMSGELNHRCATAFDVSIGQARAIDDADRAYALRGIADWRIPAKKIKKMSNGAYEQFDSITTQYAEATFAYNRNGDFPDENLVPKEPPKNIGVVDEQRAERNKAFTDALEKNPMNSVPLP
jgi:pimeloyl-ACP methyl ester carboxylesterase